MQETSEITRRSVTSGVSAGESAIQSIDSNADSSTLDEKGAERIGLTPYLLFDGNCQEAMQFYKACVGGELALTKVKESAAREHLPEFQQEKVINARLCNGALEISASDWLRPDRTPVRGNTVCLYLRGGTLDMLTHLFEKLSDGAEITDPLRKQFFGVYGALNDRFGVRWMFVTDK